MAPFLFSVSTWLYVIHITYSGCFLFRTFHPINLKITKNSCSYPVFIEYRYPFDHANWLNPVGFAFFSQEEIAIFLGEGQRAKKKNLYIPEYYGSQESVFHNGFSKVQNYHGF